MAGRASNTALSKDSRAGAAVEDRARRIRRRFLRKHWRLLTLGWIAGIAPASLYELFLQNDFMRGAMIGASLATMTAAIAGVVVVLSGSATISAGAWAEGWTSSQLRRTLRHGYQLINHAGLRKGDIDHFLVGPGGVFVFETKWSGSEWSLQDDGNRMAAACHQAQRNASTVELWLSVRRTFPVQPVLVLWGPASAALEGLEGGIAQHHGVWVIDGSELGSWMLGQPRNALGTADIDAIHAKMAKQVAGRDAKEVPRTPSLGSVAMRALCTLVVGWLALYLPSLAWSALGPWGGCFVIAAQLGGALVARRRTPFRLEALAAMVMSCGLPAMILILYAIRQLT